VGSESRPARILPPGKTRYPLYRRLGGSQGRSGQVQKVSPPPGFDPRTVQSVVSRFSGCTWRIFLNSSHRLHSMEFVTRFSLSFSLFYPLITNALDATSIHKAVSRHKTTLLESPEL
jgi:hypothetical protein